MALAPLNFSGKPFFVAFGFVGYCRVVVLGSLVLLAFQESNVPQNRPAESRNLRKNKSRTEKTQTQKPHPKRGKQKQKRYRSRGKSGELLSNSQTKEVHEAFEKSEGTKW